MLSFQLLRQAERELDRNLRRFPLQGFPFHIVTSVVDETLVVIAVAHAKRKPGYWLKRIQ